MVATVFQNYADYESAASSYADDGEQCFGPRSSLSSLSLSHQPKLYHAMGITYPNPPGTCNRDFTGLVLI